MYSILIIEDEPITLDFLATQLKDDYKIYAAIDGYQGLEYYEKVSPDIIICDIKLPFIDGIDVIKKIRKKDKNVKIIITSSKDDSKTLLEASELKLNRYLVKPINIKELKIAILESIEELKNFQVISLNKVHISENLVWERGSFSLFENDVEINLSPKEKRVLDFLLFRPNIMRGYDEIIAYVWDDETFGDKSSLKAIVTNLRKKVKDLMIDNIYGFGYKINITK